MIVGMGLILLFVLRRSKVVGQMVAAVSMVGLSIGNVPRHAVAFGEVMVQTMTEMAKERPLHFGLFWLLWVLLGLASVHWMLHSGNNRGTLSKGLTDVLLGFFRVVGLCFVAHSSHSAKLSLLLTLGVFLLWLSWTFFGPQSYGNVIHVWDRG